MKSEDENIQLSNEISDNSIQNLMSKQKKNIKKLKIMIAGVNGDSSSNYYVFKWARWLRMDYQLSYEQVYESC